MSPRRSSTASAAPTKTCSACGRTFAWRRAWKDCWDDVRWCSDACRGRGRSAADQRMEELLREWARTRGPNATFCPSDVARVVAPEGWEQRLEEVRRAARRLHAAGELAWEQGGRAVDPSHARGPVRLRWRPPAATPEVRRRGRRGEPPAT